MVTLHRPYMRSASWATPRIDLSGCVLYLPLWRPSSDMAGSTIYSYDGKVIPRISATVTGATWGSQGRTFDGIDDKIVCPAIANLVTTVGLSVWYKPASTADAYAHIAGKGAQFGVNNILFGWTVGSTGSYIRFASGNNAGLYESSGDLAVTLGVWYQLFAVRTSATNWNLYINGAPASVPTITTAYNTANGSVAFIIGTGTGSADFVGGTIGEVIVWTTSPSAGYVAQVNQITKWRYQ